MILTGHSKDPGAFRLQSLAQVFGVSVDDLLQDRSPGAPPSAPAAPGKAWPPQAAPGSDALPLAEADLTETDLRLARLLYAEGPTDTYEITSGAVMCAGLAPGTRILVAPASENAEPPETGDIVLASRGEIDQQHPALFLRLYQPPFLIPAAIGPGWPPLSLNDGSIELAGKVVAHYCQSAGTPCAALPQVPPAQAAEARVDSSAKPRKRRRAQR